VFTPGQLAFAAVASLALYLLFVFVQTVRHRDYFLPPASGPGDDATGAHSAPPSTRATAASLGLLMVSLVAVVGLAKIESAPIEDTGKAVGAPQSAARVIIALTIPTLAIASIWLSGPLVLGLEPTQIVLLFITMLVVAVTILPGRSTLQAADPSEPGVMPRSASSAAMAPATVAGSGISNGRRVGPPAARVALMRAVTRGMRAR
jgi:Ca2+:H+ antiporter